MNTFEECACQALEALRGLERTCWTYKEQLALLREENAQLRAELAKAQAEEVS